MCDGGGNKIKKRLQKEAQSFSDTVTGNLASSTGESDAKDVAKDVKIDEPIEEAPEEAEEEEAEDTTAADAADLARRQLMAARAEARRKLALKSGRRSTILTSGQGVIAPQTTKRKQLLGE